MRQLVMLTLVAAFILAGATAHAQIKIPYQGKLTDVSGEPVPNGNYSVTFSLWDSLTAGNQLWSETRSVTTDNGLFSLMLGEDQPIELGDAKKTRFTVPVKHVANPVSKPVTSFNISE